VLTVAKFAAVAPGTPRAQTALAMPNSGSKDSGGNGDDDDDDDDDDEGTGSPMAPNRPPLPPTGSSSSGTEFSRSCLWSDSRQIMSPQASRNFSTRL